MAFNGEIRKINMRIRRMYEYCWCHAIKDHLVQGFQMINFSR